MPKIKSKDPIASARAALTGVLDRAIACKDDDRILASAKLVLSTLEKEKPATTTKPDHLDVQLLTVEEFLELEILLDPLIAFKKRALARIASDAANIAGTATASVLR